MTRSERLAEAARKTKEALETKQLALAKITSAQRGEARKERDKRRGYVGTLAEHCGLFLWDDTTLEKLFTLLATLKETSNPVAVLEGLLTDPAVGDILVLDSDGDVQPLWRLEKENGRA